MEEGSGLPEVTRWARHEHRRRHRGRPGPPHGPGDRPHLRVALGRRVEVIGDLLLPPEPTDSSPAACRDIARRLEEWQGPGIVILCGRLVAPGCPPPLRPPTSCGAHPELTAALARLRGPRRLAGRRGHGRAERDPDLVRALEGCGVEVRDAVDLACETGAGTRTVLVRAGTMRPDATPPIDAAPSEDRPWLAGMERLDDPRWRAASSPRACSTAGCAAYLWAPPLVAGRHCPAAARRLRDRRPRPHLPLAPPADRAAARLRRHVVLPLPRHGRDRGRSCSRCWPSWWPSPPAASGGRSAARASPRPGRAARPGGAPDRARPARDRRRGRPRRRPAPPSRPAPRGRHRRRGARARADPSRRRVLRLPRAPPPRSSTSTGDGSGSRRRSCTTARSRPSRSRPAPTCTSACSWPRPTCPWPPWASAW